MLSNDQISAINSNVANLRSAPNNIYVQLNNGQVYLKQPGASIWGYQLTPVFDKSYQGQEVTQLNLGPQDVGRAGSVAPDQYGIGYNGQTADQASAAYNGALNDKTTPRSNALPPSMQVQGAASSSFANPPKSPAAPQLPFKAGLTPAQQQSITHLISMTQNGYQLNANDQKNLQYALGNNWQKYVSQGTSSNNSGTNAATGAAGSSGSATGIQLQTADQYRKMLQGMGIDTSQLNDQQIQTLGMMQQVVQSNASNDKNIAPPSLSAADMQNYLNQATAQIDPFYKDQFKQASQDALFQIGQITGQNTQNEQQMAQDFQNQIDSTQSQLAEAGLAQSGLRKKAEDQLQQQQQGSVQSNRRQLQQQVYTLGSNLERMYGSQAASLYPQIQSQALAGLPGQTIGYNPIGVQYPTQQQQEQTDIINRQTQLAQKGAAAKGFNQTGTYTQI